MKTKVITLALYYDIENNMTVVRNHKAEKYILPQGYERISQPISVTFNLLNNKTKNVLQVKQLDDKIKKLSTEITTLRNEREEVLDNERN